MCGRTAETAEEEELQAYIDHLRVTRYPKDFPHRQNVERANSAFVRWGSKAWYTFDLGK